MRIGSLSTKLLRICTNLNAKEDRLALLSLLGKKFSVGYQTSSLSLLNISQQLHLIVEMYEFNSSSLNQDVGVRQYLRQMANVLHVTLELNPSEVPLGLFNLDVLKCLAALGNHSIVVLTMGDCLRAVDAPSEFSTKQTLLTRADRLVGLAGRDVRSPDLRPMSARSCQRNRHR